MTIEQLCECSAEELSKLTDEQLVEYLSPYLKATRPDLLDKSKIHKVDRTKDHVEKIQNEFVMSKINSVLDKAKKLGITE